MNRLRIAIGGGSKDSRGAVHAALLAGAAFDPELVAPLVPTETVKKLAPALVVLVMDEPRQTIDIARRIMAEAPTPIVLVAASPPGGAEDILARSGALALLEPPRDATQLRRFVASIQAMAEVKVVRRWRRDIMEPATAPMARPAGSGRLVVIASSTGGPGALQKIFAGLPKDFDAPILVVQHIAQGFADNLVRSLSANGLRIKIAQAGETLAPAVAYFAPDNQHLGVSARNTITLTSGPPIEGFRPSATFLFEAAAKAFAERLTAVVLTGMGRDGTAGLRAIHENGGTIIAQDQDSSVVFGMPKAAIESGLVDLVLPLNDIARELAGRTIAGEVLA